MAKGIRCKGKVQGVFFRATAKSTADDLGLKGWVKNERDGTVLIHAEGIESQIALLFQWCHQGPQFAKVDEVVGWEKPNEGFDSFEIRRD